MKLKQINKQGTKIINDTAKGNECNQQNCINWSYLNLGKVALAKTNMKQIIQVLIPKIRPVSDNILLK